MISSTFIEYFLSFRLQIWWLRLNRLNLFTMSRSNNHDHKDSLLIVGLEQHVDASFPFSHKCIWMVFALNHRQPNRIRVKNPYIALVPEIKRQYLEFFKSSCYCSVCIYLISYSCLLFAFAFLVVTEYYTKPNQIKWLHRACVISVGAAA